MTPAVPAGVGMSGTGERGGDDVSRWAASARAVAARRPASTVRQRRIAEISVVVVMLVWGSNFIVVKAATEVLPPVGMSALRFAIAALVLLVLLRWREGSLWLPARDLVAVATIGALGFGVYQALWVVGLLGISAGDSALLIASTPVLTALLAVAAGADTLSRTKLAGAVLSLTGVAVVIAAGQGLSMAGSLVGYALTLGAALCWAVYTSFGAPILRRHSPLRTTAWAVTAGALVLGIPGGLQLAALDWSAVPPVVWLAMAYSAIVPAALSNVVVFHAVKLLGPTRIAAFQFLVPAFAVLLGALLLAEPIRLAQVVGGAVIVAGILVTRSGGAWWRAVTLRRTVA